MKAITTKFIGPTNFRGSRYAASDGDGNRVYVSADHAKTYEENHDTAALTLCQKMGSGGTLVRGYMECGNVYVWLHNGGTLRIQAKES